MAAKDAQDMSGVLAVLWDPRWLNLKAYELIVGVLVSSFIRGYEDKVHFLNLYALHKDRISFWDTLVAGDLLKIGSLIIVGDYNATMSRDEIWGCRAKRDPLAERLIDIFDNNNLVDIRPSPLAPTWCNGREGDQNIGKRLDR